MGRTKEMLPEHDEYSGQDDYGYEPDLDGLRHIKDSTNQHWHALIVALPAMNMRSREQQALIDAARECALAARDAFYEAGGTP